MKDTETKTQDNLTDIICENCDFKLYESEVGLGVCCSCLEIGSEMAVEEGLV